jgi:hypothetical protein
VLADAQTLSRRLAPDDRHTLDEFMEMIRGIELRIEKMDLRRQLRSREFRRVEVDDRRYGGIITNAAMLSMTSGPKRTHPVARGVWIIEVILNDPPAPPPNDVPPLNEEAGDKHQTIRKRFAAHRDNPSCAGCHSKLDPLGFALENFDITGRWREKYDNGRSVDATGTLLRKYEFANVPDFKDSLLHERRRFAKAFTTSGNSCSAPGGTPCSIRDRTCECRPSCL